VQRRANERSEAERRPRRSLSEREAEYLAENTLGRVATVSPAKQPHVVPVVYRFDGRDILFTGWNLTRSLKYRNLLANNRVAFVVDDVVSTRPWRVRGVEVRGRAELSTESSGEAIVKIVPEDVRSWGLRE